MTERLTILFFLILTAFTANCQDSTNFEYWISDIDKAGYSRVTYHITSDSIVVKSGPYDFIYFSKCFFSKCPKLWDRYILRKYD